MGDGAGGSGGCPPSCAICTPPRGSFTKSENDFAAMTVAEDARTVITAASASCFPYESCIEEAT